MKIVLIGLLLVVASFERIFLPDGLLNNQLFVPSSDLVIENIDKSAVKSLKIEGAFKRNSGGKEIHTGNFLYLFQGSDQYYRKEITNFPGNSGQLIEIGILNKNRGWFDVKSTSAGAEVINDLGDGTKQEQEERLRNGLRGQAANYLLQFLLKTSSYCPIDTKMIGEAVADNGEQAEAYEIKGQCDPVIKQIFLDKKSRALKLIKYKVKKESLTISVSNGKSVVNSPKSEEIKYQEVSLYFSDYKDVVGFQLPHTLKKEINGVTLEEYEVKKYTINAKIEDAIFIKK